MKQYCTIEQMCSDAHSITLNKLKSLKKYFVQNNKSSFYVTICSYARRSILIFENNYNRPANGLKRNQNKVANYSTPFIELFQPIWCLVLCHKCNYTLGDTCIIKIRMFIELFVCVFRSNSFHHWATAVFSWLWEHMCAP